jgi:hypothetical protein
MDAVARRRLRRLNIMIVLMCDGDCVLFLRGKLDL